MKRCRSWITSLNAQYTSATFDLGEDKGLCKGVFLYPTHLMKTARGTEMASAIVSVFVSPGVLHWCLSECF